MQYCTPDWFDRQHQGCRQLSEHWKFLKLGDVLNWSNIYNPVKSGAKVPLTAEIESFYVGQIFQEITGMCSGKGISSLDAEEVFTRINGKTGKLHQIRRMDVSGHLSISHLDCSAC
jgi:hypothetical protein